MLRARSEAATSRPMKLAPSTTARRRRLRSFDDRLAVLQRAKHEHVRRLGAGEGRGHGLGAGRQKQAIVRKLVAGRERDFARAGVDGGDGRIQAKVDGIVGIELGVAQRQPVFRRAAGEIILGQIWPIDRRRVVAAQHDEIALVFLPPQHLGRGESSRAAADDHDPASARPIWREASSPAECSSRARRSCRRAARRATC